jgi:hypothetical protein
MPAMFDTTEAKAEATATQSGPDVQAPSDVPGRVDPLQQAGTSDLGTEQSWDTFHQHMLLVVQATQNLGVKLTAIFNP